MSENNERREYESFRVPDRQQRQGDGVVQAPQRVATESASSRSDGMYYEIEYGSHPIPGVGKYVLRPQKIEEPERDEIRELFGQMRNIARAERRAYDYSKFFDRRVHQKNAEIFYKQGMFMKDFSDNYEGYKEFSQYYPYYQMMGYEQLRTYFTWRTEVRKGNVADTTLSYCFLYIYELLNNIGVKDPQDGLDKLMFFWKAFSVYNKAIDKYVLRWLKDYHVYYELPQSFKDFITKNNLIEYYPRMADTDDNFDLFCNISKYDIRKSAFFTEDRIQFITDCFYFVTGKLRQVFLKNGIQFDDSVFQPTKKMSVWTPFRDALFYQWVKQPNRRIVLSEKEIYMCTGNKWAFSTVITTESGRQLIGYVIKQMEAALRRVTKYKYKLSADISTVTHVGVSKLRDAGISLEGIINDAVIAFYREETKTVVKVDLSTLTQIRQEALITQEKLLVPEQEEQAPPTLKPLNLSLMTPLETPTLENEPTSMSDAWEGLKDALTEVEIQALAIVLHRETEIKRFADECGIMLEVLVDGINEKTMDYIGDSLIDEENVLYEDYINQVKEMVG